MLVIIHSIIIDNSIYIINNHKRFLTKFSYTIYIYLFFYYSRKALLSFLPKHLKLHKVPNDGCKIVMPLSSAQSQGRQMVILGSRSSSQKNRYGMCRMRDWPKIQMDCAYKMRWAYFQRLVQYRELKFKSALIVSCQISTIDFTYLRGRDE